MLVMNSCFSLRLDSNADFILDFENDTIDIVAVKDIKAGEEITLNYHGESGDKTPLWFEFDD